MSEERRRILDMLASGKISSEEAERLLDALARASEHPGPAAEPIEGGSRKRPKYLRVQVTPKNGGRETVNIRVPLLLLRTGIKLSGLMPDKTREKVNDALGRKGIDVDFNELKGEQLEAILGSLQDMSIDVDDEKEFVRVFCE